MDISGNWTAYIAQTQHAFSINTAQLSDLPFKFMSLCNPALDPIQTNVKAYRLGFVKFLYCKNVVNLVSSPDCSFPSPFF